MQKEATTENKIKEAAEKIFLKKGLDGARMQDIADEAKVNKAMLNYYFRTKKALFGIIFIEKFAMLFGNLGGIMMSDLPFEEKIKQFVHKEIELLTQMPMLPIFVVNELQKDPDLLTEKLKNLPVHVVLESVKQKYDIEVKTGRFRDIPFSQFMVNMISLCIFPIMAQHLLKFFLKFDDEQYSDFLEARKTIVSDFLVKYMIIK